jgi:hypothetical protein
MPHNALHHLPAEAGEARWSRSGACGCYAAFAEKQHPASIFEPKRTLDTIVQHDQFWPWRTSDGSRGRAGGLFGL